MRSMIRLAPLLLLAACVVKTPGAAATSAPGGTAATTPADAPAAPAAQSPTTSAAADAAFVGSPSTTKAGEDPSRQAATCDGAHDHCLPPGALFATEWQRGEPGEAVVTAPIESGLWAWKRSDVMRGDYRGLQTERATSANLAIGAVAVAFRMGSSFGALPRNESDAVAVDWVVGTIAAIDLGSGSFQIEGLDAAIPIVASRVVTGPR